jgi:hypothetical protein
MSIEGISKSALLEAQPSAQTMREAARLLAEMDSGYGGSASERESATFGEILEAQCTSRGTNAPLSPFADQPLASADRNGDRSISFDELSSMLRQAEFQARAG